MPPRPLPEPGDPAAEVCSCGLRRWRFYGLLICATCDRAPRYQIDPTSAHPRALP